MLIKHQPIATTSIRVLNTSSEIEAAQRLRFDVWQSEGVTVWSRQQKLIADSHDDHAMHWGVFDKGAMVAAARLCMHTEISQAPDGEMFSTVALPSPIASLNRLVVLRSHRGIGIGQMLDRERIQSALALRAKCVICTPVNVLSRKRSLGELGFQFLADVEGCSIWSSAVKILACYMLADPTGKKME